MKRKIINFEIQNEQYRIAAYLDGLSERVNELPVPALSGRRLQSESQVELPLQDATRDALLPPPTGMVSVLDRAFKGEL